MRQDIRDRLIQAARRSEVVFYRELGIGRGRAVGVILEEISEYEHSSGHPLLSAIVVLKGTGMPSEGFWRDSGIPRNLTDKQRPVFWAKELTEVINYWQSHPNG